MKQVKPLAQKSDEDLFNEATDGRGLSSSDLRLLTSGLVALRKAHDEPLNKIELQAVYGMISYVAHDQKVEEGMVGEIMTSHFGISSVAALPSRLYQNAIEYLVDLKMDNLIN